MKEITLEKYVQRLKDPIDHVLEINVDLSPENDVDEIKIKLELIFRDLNEKYIFIPTPLKCPSVEAANALKEAMNDDMIWAMVENMNKHAIEIY